MTTRTSLALCGLITAVIGLSASAVKAQPNAAAPIPETIQTADGMKLKGLFHPAKTFKPGRNASSSPVVVLLYPPGPDRSMATGAWEGLAKALNAEGFHVFRFDWRGHGKSTDIDGPLGMDAFSGFWTNHYSGPWNVKYIRGALKKPVKNDFFVNQVTNANYYPMYVQDLAAIRLHLDQKSDQGELNSSTIYLIGAEDVAPLALLWLTAEWNRPGIHPLLGGGQMYKVVPTPYILNEPEGGKDIAGAVWLSASRPPNRVSSINDRLMQNWLRNTIAVRDQNPMLFLYGERDTASKAAARFYFDEVLVANGNPGAGIKALEQTFIRDVKGTNLKGVGLLGMADGTKTEDTILAYLKQLEMKRGTVIAKNRGYVGPYYVDVTRFGIGYP